MTIKPIPTAQVSSGNLQTLGDVAHPPVEMRKPTAAVQHSEQQSEYEDVFKKHGYEASTRSHVGSVHKHKDGHLIHMFTSSKPHVWVHQTASAGVGNLSAGYSANDLHDFLSNYHQAGETQHAEKPKKPYRIFNNGGAGWSVQHRASKKMISFFKSEGNPHWSNHPDNAAVYNSEEEAHEAAKLALPYHKDDEQYAENPLAEFGSKYPHNTYLHGRYTGKYRGGELDEDALEGFHDLVHQHGGASHDGEHFAIPRPAWIKFKNAAANAGHRHSYTWKNGPLGVAPSQHAEAEEVDPWYEEFQFAELHKEPHEMTSHEFNQHVPVLSFDDVKHGEPVTLHAWHGTRNWTPIEEHGFKLPEHRAHGFAPGTAIQKVKNHARVNESEYDQRHLLGDGTYVADSKAESSKYGEARKVKVTLKKPYVIEHGSIGKFRQLSPTALKAEGYDGVLVKSGRYGIHGGENYRQAVAFNPESVSLLHESEHKPKFAKLQNRVKVIHRETGEKGEVRGVNYFSEGHQAWRKENNQPHSLGYVSVRWSGSKKHGTKARTEHKVPHEHVIVENSHEHHVMNALKSGKAVPPHVLAEYPHLAKPEQHAEQGSHFELHTDPLEYRDKDDEYLYHVTTRPDEEEFAGDYRVVPDSIYSRDSKYHDLLKTRGYKYIGAGKGDWTHYYYHPEKDAHARIEFNHSNDVHGTLKHGPSTGKDWDTGPIEQEDQYKESEQFEQQEEFSPRNDRERQMVGRINELSQEAAKAKSSGNYQLLRHHMQQLSELHNSLQNYTGHKLVVRGHSVFHYDRKPKRQQKESE